MKQKITIQTTATVGDDHVQTKVLAENGLNGEAVAI